jgi:hypothetical protein
MRRVDHRRIPPGTPGPALRGLVRGVGGRSDDALRVRFPRDHLRVAPGRRAPRALTGQLRRELLRSAVHRPASSGTVPHHLHHPNPEHR